MGLDTIFQLFIVYWFLYSLQGIFLELAVVGGFNKLVKEALFLLIHFAISELLHFTDGAINLEQKPIDGSIVHLLSLHLIVNP